MKKLTYTKQGRKEYIQSVSTYDQLIVAGKSYFTFGRFDLQKLIASFPSCTPRYVTPKITADIDPLEMAPNFEFFKYQTDIIDHIMANNFNEIKVTNNEASCILQLGTGKGKTFIAGGLIHRINQRALIIVPLLKLQDQAVDDLRLMFPSASISKYPNPAAQIVVLVHITACSLPIDFFNNFCITIFDEFPSFCTEEYRMIFRRAKSIYSIGMSATPYRADTMHRYAEIYLGQVIKESTFNIIDLDFKIDTEFVGYVAISPIKPSINKTTKTISYLESCISCLSYDAARNDLIVKLSLRLLEAGHCHYVFTLTIIHAHTIAQMLSKQLKDEHISTIAGGSAASDSYYSLRNSTIIIGTYQGMGMGISVVNMTGAIFAMMPFETQIEQVYGRIKRVNKDNPEMNDKVRKVYVVEDLSHRWLYSHYMNLRERLMPKNDIEIDDI